MLHDSDAGRPAEAALDFTHLAYRLVPQVRGFLGQPTIVNNVETFCNLPHIFANGVDWFKGLGLTGNGGTKIMGASGRIKKPAPNVANESMSEAYSLPLGKKVRAIALERARRWKRSLRSKTSSDPRPAHLSW